MTHFDNHQQAYLKSNIVVQVSIFNEHDIELINKIKILGEYDSVIDCCEIGTIPPIGWEWNGTEFINPNPPIVEDLV